MSIKSILDSIKKTIEQIREVKETETRVKRQALIVAEKNKEEKFYTDGVIVYDSYCLSKDKPQVLQFGGSLTDDVIYITGHGKKKNQTISGLTMKEIADMLVEKWNYTGTQKIEIMSCYGTYMEELLRKELSEKISNKTVEELERVYKLHKKDVSDLKSELLKDYTGICKDKLELALNSETCDLKFNCVKDFLIGEITNLLKDKVTAYAEHTTIVVESFGKCYVRNLKCVMKFFGKYDVEWLETLFGLWFGKLQYKYLKKLDKKGLEASEIELTKNNYTQELEEHHNKNKVYIARHNYSYIERGLNKIMLLEWLSFGFVISLILAAAVFFIGGYFVGKSYWLTTLVFSITVGLLLLATVCVVTTMTILNM